MPAPRKFDEETRARAVRLSRDRMRDHGATKLGARRHVGELLGIAPAILRNWIEAGERATKPVIESAGDDSAELRRLRLEVAELHRANEILKTASAFFAQVRRSSTADSGRAALR